MGHLQELHEQFKDKGLVILGFNCVDDRQIALDFIHQKAATFPSILDASDAAEKVSLQDYQSGDTVPLSYVIDREGKIVDAWYGYQEGSPKAIAALKKAGGRLEEAVRQEEHTRVMQSAKDVTAAAQRLFQAIRAADYDHDWISTGDWERFPAADVDYMVDRGYPGWVRWVCRKFKANPITQVRLGKVFPGPEGRPTLHFELRLKDGEVLQGDLPFKEYPEPGQWIGYLGLDWHLRNAK